MKRITRISLAELVVRGAMRDPGLRGYIAAEPKPASATIIPFQKRPATAAARTNEE